MCEEISHVVQSCVRDQVVYTMTSHQALCLDLRFGFVQRWTHMMAAPPQYGFTQTVGDKYVFSTHLRFRESKFWMKSAGKVQFATTTCGTLIQSTFITQSSHCRAS